MYSFTFCCIIQETVGDSLVREVREAKTRQSNLGGRARGGKRKKLNWIKKQKTKGREKKNVKQGKEKIKGNKKRKNKNKTQRGKGSTMKNNKKTQQRIKGNHKKTELNQLITKNKKSKNISQKRTMKKNAKDRKKENKFCDCNVPTTTSASATTTTTTTTTISISCEAFPTRANMRDYKYARNQLQKAKRVKKFFATLDKKREKAATLFQDAVSFFKDCPAASSFYPELR